MDDVVSSKFQVLASRFRRFFSCIYSSVLSKFFFFFWLHHISLWDLSSPTRVQTQAPCSGSTGS